MPNETVLTNNNNISLPEQLKSKNGISISPEQYLRATGLKIASNIKHNSLPELLHDADRVVKYILEGK